jgi:hypothetical protein
MSIAMWQSLQDLIARVDALEKRQLEQHGDPGLTQVLERLDKFEKILGKYMAPKRG